MTTQRADDEGANGGIADALEERRVNRLLARALFLRHRLG
jgi:hypothetical protein